MRIGLNTEMFIEWGGGVDFLRLILKGISKLKQEKEIKVYVLIANKKISLANQIKVRIKGLINRILGYNKYSLQMAVPVDLAATKLVLAHECEVEFVEFESGKDALKQEALKLKLDLILPCFYSLGKEFPIPWMGYLFDFQHKYYPAFFSVKEVKNRDIQFERMLREAPAVIVNSMAVKRDIQRFFPDLHTDVVTLPFCPFYEVSAEQKKIEERDSKYPEHYFLISNQFWKHKDHATAFRGLARFYELQGSKDIHLICTGEMQDYRFPNYFNELKLLVQQLGIEQEVHFLGYIPKREQQSILDRAICLIQPTLFEGGPGGGAVYEALAKGKIVVLSDIEVNQEIQKPWCLFFKSGDADSLAQALLKSLHTSKPDAQQLLADSIAESNALGQVLGQAFEQVKK